MTIRRYISLCSLLILSLCSTLVQAKLLNIIIDGGQITGIPVAVVPFGVEGADKSVGLNVSDVIHADLKSSGQFSPLPSGQIRQFPSQSSEVQYPYWQSVKVENLVVGKIRRMGSGYAVHFALLDVVKQKAGVSGAPLLSMQFDNVQPHNLRALAHHMSDLIFQKLIGTRGFFSTRIAYIATNQSVGGMRTLEVADYDGFNPKPLYRSNYPIMSPAWSPDSKKIAFVSFEKERSSINVVDVASGRVQRLTQYPGINSAPAWSPDGRMLALVLSKDGGPKIYTLDIASRSLNKVTDGHGIDTEPCFSPDGRSIVFTSDRGGKPQIYRVTLGSGRTERLTFAGNYNAKPSMTPDGKNLVTLHRGDEGLFSIALHSLANGGVRILTQTGLNDSPALAPNGMMVIYGAEERGHRVLSAVTLDGRLKIRLPGQEGEVQEPAWSPFAPA